MITIYFDNEINIYECEKCDYEHMDITNVYNHYCENHIKSIEEIGDVILKDIKYKTNIEDE